MSDSEPYTLNILDTWRILPTGIYTLQYFQQDIHVYILHGQRRALQLVFYKNLPHPLSSIQTNFKVWSEKFELCHNTCIEY